MLNVHNALVVQDFQALMIALSGKNISFVFHCKIKVLLISHYVRMCNFHFDWTISFNDQHSYLAVFWVVEWMHILCSVCVCLSVGEWKV